MSYGMEVKGFDLPESAEDLKLSPYMEHCQPFVVRSKQNHADRSVVIRPGPDSDSVVFFDSDGVIRYSMIEFLVQDYEMMPRHGEVTVTLKVPAKP